MAISTRIASPQPAVAASRGSGLLVIDPSFPAATRAAYEQTLLNVRYALLGDGGNTLLISAVDPATAAAPLAANLALLAAQDGEDVLLIDGDLHRPSLDGLFAVEQRPGFATAVRQDTADAAAALQTIDIANLRGRLRVLPAGDGGGIPGGIGRARGLGEAMLRLKNSAERVVLIGAPLLAQVDSLDLCPYVNGVVAVARSGATHREDAARARDLLARVNAPFLGVVLTEARRKAR